MSRSASPPPDRRQADTIERALDVDRAGGRLFSAVQATWNLLETSAGPALRPASRRELTVIVKESLANGRLVTDPPPVLLDMANRLGATPDAVALAAAAQQPWADRVLLGPAGLGQLAQNLQAAEITLSAADLALVAALADDPDRLLAAPLGAALAVSPCAPVRRRLRRQRQAIPASRPSRPARHRARPGSGRSPPPAHPGRRPRARLAASMSPRSALISAILARGERDGAAGGAAGDDRLGVLFGPQQGVREGFDGIGRRGQHRRGHRHRRLRTVPVRHLRRDVPHRPGQRPTCTSTICRVSLACCSRSSAFSQDARPGCSFIDCVALSTSDSAAVANRPCSRAVRSQPDACSNGPGRG